MGTQTVFCKLLLHALLEAFSTESQGKHPALRCCLDEHDHPSTCGSLHRHGCKSFAPHSSLWKNSKISGLQNVMRAAQIVLLQYRGQSMQFWRSQSGSKIDISLTDPILECSALKTVLGESCDAVAQAQAMSYLNLAWGLGTILGPVIGGYFAYPCDGTLIHESPFCEHGGWLRTRYTTSLPHISHEGNAFSMQSFAPHSSTAPCHMPSCLTQSLTLLRQHCPVWVSSKSYYPDLPYHAACYVQDSLPQHVVHSNSHGITLSQTGKCCTTLASLRTSVQGRCSLCMGIAQLRKMIQVICCPGSSRLEARAAVQARAHFSAAHDLP